MANFCSFCLYELKTHVMPAEFLWSDLTREFYSQARSELKLNVADLDSYGDLPVYVHFADDGKAREIQMWSCKKDEDKFSSSPLPTSEEWTTLRNYIIKHCDFQPKYRKGSRGVPEMILYTPNLTDIMREKGTQYRHPTRMPPMTSTKFFCEYCGEELNTNCFMVEKAIRVMFIGYRSSGKTVFATQLITEIANQTHENLQFHCTPVNANVESRYRENADRIKNKNLPVATSDPQVRPWAFLLERGGEKVLLILQDIMGEDLKKRSSYYTSFIQNADMFLFFIDPWTISSKGSRPFPLQHKVDSERKKTMNIHKKNKEGDDLTSVFFKLLSGSISDRSPHYAGIVLTKGDDCYPNMLENEHDKGGNYRTMWEHKTINFRERSEALRAITIRSGVVQNLISIFDPDFVNDIANRFSPSKTRYFVLTALGQTPIFVETEKVDEPSIHRSVAAKKHSVYGDQFNVESSSDVIKTSNNENNDKIVDTSFEVEESDFNQTDDKEKQKLTDMARPAHIVDPIFWILLCEKLLFE